MSEENNIEVSIETILNEIGIKNADLASLELAVSKANHALIDAKATLDAANSALERAKEQPDLRSVVGEKAEAMLNLGLSSSAIIEALRIQYPSKKKQLKGSEGLSLDEKTKATVREFVLSFTEAFRTSDVWDRFSDYKRPDIFAVISTLVKSKKVVKRGEKRGVHYYVAEYAPAVAA